MSVDRAELVEILATMPFERGAWVVAGSAPMLMAGLIDSISDLDVVVDGIAWEDALSLSDTPPTQGLHGDRMLSMRVGDAVVEIFDGWLGVGADATIAEAVELGGFPFSPLSRVLESKRQLDRNKDLAHVELLEAFLATGRQPTGRSQ